ncbi:hypothetical protein M6C35_002047 [Vibrio metschnikovii]|nr:hypothetical protein [Vibrio metschnikovii]
MARWHKETKHRYDFQGELQNELTEKLEIAIENITKSKRKMLAQDVYDLLSISVYSTDFTSEEKFSEHVMKELNVVRKPLIES